MDEFYSKEPLVSREVSHGEAGHERVYEIELVKNWENGSTPERKAFIVRDITVYKRALVYWESQYRRYSDYLKRIVRQRTKQLRDAERMAAIGELAAMVGHDIRNPLTAISGATHFLKKKSSVSSDERSREMLEIIEQNVEDSNKIVNDLLEFSREIQITKSAVDLRKLVEGVLSQVEIPENVVVNNNVGEELVELDELQIKRVFVNIVRNALDAMPEGGTLTITSSISLNGLEVSFEDTGVGIPEEILDDIWKPLFTTKAKGLGFGLAICKRIVDLHDGEIAVESHLGKGSNFSIVFPVASDFLGDHVFTRIDDCYQRLT